MATQISVNSSTGNIQVTTSRTAIGTVVSANTANYANFAGEANIANTATNANFALVANIANTANVANIANVANTATNLNAASTANVVIGGGTAGYVLSTDGAGTLSWTAQTGGGGNGTPGGANTAVQFNDAGTFGGEATFTYNKVTNLLTVDHIAGEGGNLSNIQIANITGIGNIASINLDGNVSNVLRGDGTFSADAGGAPGGSNTQVQYNNNGAFAGEAGFEYNDVTNTLTVDNISANISGTVTGDVDGALLVDVYNDTGSTLNKGDAVYLTGGNTGDNPHVAPADADDPTKMPALGVVKENIAPTAVGQVVTSGVMNDSSHGYTLGADLYVSTTPGQLTTTVPTSEANAIQKIGKVINPNQIIVQGAFRTNQTPNLDDGNIFIGNATNQATTANLYGEINTHLAAFGSNTITTTGNVDVGNLVSTGNIDVANHVNVTPDGVISTAPINTLNYGTNPSSADLSSVAIFKRGRGDSVTPQSINLFDELGTIEWQPQTLDGGGNFEGSFSAGIVPYVTGITGNVVATNMRLYTKSDAGTLNYIQLDKNGVFRNDGETELNNNLFVQGSDPNNPKTIQSYNGGVTVIMDNINSAYPSFVFNTYNNTGSVINPYTFFRARGDQNTPAQVQGGDVVKSEQWYAYADSGNTYYSLGGLNAIVSANDGAGNVQVNSSVTSGTTTGALNRTNGSKFIIDTNFTETTNDLRVGNDTSTGGNLTLFRNVDGSSSGQNPQGFITNYNRVYGVFGESSSIVLGSATTPAKLAVTNTDINNNITNSAGTFTVDIDGVYAIEVEAQLLNSATPGTDYSAWFWVRVNGTDVAESFHTFDVRGGRENTATFIQNLVLNASDQVEIYWAVENTLVTCVARAANSQGFTHPAQNSASVSITPVGA